MVGRLLFRLSIMVLSFLRSSSTSLGCSAAILSLRFLMSLAKLLSFTWATDKSVRALSRSTSWVFASLLSRSAVSCSDLILALISAIVVLILLIFVLLSLITFWLLEMLDSKAALVSLASCSLASRSLIKLMVVVNLSLSLLILFL